MPSKMFLSKTALRLFGKLTEPYLIYFDSLRLNLKKAGIKAPVNEYIAAVVFYSLLGFIVTIIAGSVMLAYFIPQVTASVSVYDTIYSYTLAIIVSFFAAGGIFFLGYYYPLMSAKSIRAKMGTRATLVRVIRLGAFQNFSPVLRSISFSRFLSSRCLVSAQAPAGYRWP